jgi:hypothetical protein
MSDQDSVYSTEKESGDEQEVPDQGMQVEAEGEVIEVLRDSSEPFLEIKAVT